MLEKKLTLAQDIAHDNLSGGLIESDLTSRLFSTNHPSDRSVFSLAKAFDDDYLFGSPEPPVLLAIVDDSFRHHLTDARKLDQLTGGGEVQIQARPLRLSLCTGSLVSLVR